MINFKRFFTLSLLCLLTCNITIPSNNQIDDDEDDTIFDENMRYNFIQNHDWISLFDTHTIPALPYQRLLQGILEGSNPYQLLSIDTDPVTPYAIIKSASDYIYLIGRPNQEQLESILQICASYKELLLICDESVQGYFVQHGFVIHPRLEFVYDNNGTLPYQQLPEEFEIMPLNISLFEQSPWYKIVALMHGGKQRFLDHSFGFALCNSDHVAVAFAYGIFIGNDACEIGVVTHPDHRGKGYILYPAAALIQECSHRNLTPVWSCDSDNTASLKTALKLNFKIARHYSFLRK